MQLKLLIPLILATGVLFAGCTGTPAEEELPIKQVDTPRSVAVEYWNPSTTPELEYTVRGTVILPEETTITAQEGGIVTTMTLKVGDRINIGDPVATIGTNNTNNTLELQLSNLQTSLRQVEESKRLTSTNLDNGLVLQELAVTNSERQLARAKERKTEVERSLAQEESTALLQLENAQSQITLAAGSAQTAVTQAEEQLQNTIANNQRTLQDTRRNAEIQALQWMRTLTMLQDESNDILGKDWPKQRNDTRSYALGILNPQLQNDTSIAYNRYRNSLRDLQALPEEQSIEDKLIAMDTTIQEGIALVELLYRLPDLSVAELFSNPSELQSLRTQINTLKNGPTTVYTLQTQLAQTQQQLRTLKEQQAQQETQGRLAIEAARNNLANANQQTNTMDTSIAIRNAEAQLASLALRKEVELQNAQRAIEDAQLQLEQAGKQYIQAVSNKDAQLQSFENQLKDLRGQQLLLLERSQNLIVRSPAQGTVLTVHTPQGSTASSGTPLISIGNTTEPRVRIEITQAMAELLDITTLTVQDSTLTLVGGSPVLDQSSGLRQLEYAYPSGALPAGSTVAGSLTYMKEESQIALPVTLTYNDTEGTYLFVDEKNLATKHYLPEFLIRGDFLLVNTSAIEGKKIIQTRSPLLEEGILLTPATND